MTWQLLKRLIFLFYLYLTKLLLSHVILIKQTSHELGIGFVKMMRLSLFQTQNRGYPRTHPNLYWSMNKRFKTFSEVK